MSEFGGPWGGPRPTPPPPPKRAFRVGLILWLGLLAATGLAVFLLARLFPGQLASADDRMEALRLFGLLALVSSGLVAARRVNLGATARRIALWAAIFALGVIGYTFRDDALAVGLRLRSALIPGQPIAVAPRSVVVGRAEDGAFYVMGQVNGAPVRFVIDTGASDILLSRADAQRAGLDTTALRFARPSETANGVGFSAAAHVASLAVGPIRLTDVPVQVNQAPMSASLLGMPFLRRLDSFEVRGDRLFLRGRAP